MKQILIPEKHEQGVIEVVSYIEPPWGYRSYELTVSYGEVSVFLCLNKREVEALREMLDR